MSNIPLTPIAQAWLEQIMALGDENPATVVEQALQYFHEHRLKESQTEVSNPTISAIDTTCGFPKLSEAEILEDNERRWETFQQTKEGGLTHDQMLQHWAEALQMGQ